MVNTTDVHGRVGWVSEPVTRGTASLVYSCISTIIICTWSALHLNVPGVKDSTMTIFLRKVKYFAIAFVAPEYAAWVAYTQYIHTQQISKLFKKHKKSIPWHDTLGYLIVMGGVHIRDQTGDTIILPPDQVQLCLQNEWIDFRKLSRKEVNDKSKANWFNKTIAFFQISWFLIQVIGRAATHLPITALELFTLAYVVCALSAYCFWWNKPVDLQVPIILPATSSFGVNKQTVARSSEWEDGILRGRLGALDAGYTPQSEYWVFLSFSIFTSLFGACHLLGWNAVFPTIVERLLWRIGSVACGGYPIAGFIVGRLLGRFQVANAIGEPIAFVLLMPYILVRLFLMAEVFVALRSVPPQVYATVRWSQYIPHI
ncbi:hypothetical protein BCR34DRAFT_237540 [Clohesyomyces aquaticus]|uniref:Uncharacterized protein n=1 Tax=Clohesyomyces aquaticus TaxID=1231657 RepID=A0A1Y1ZVQ9_9PLEO|nr:hypothetical protein BCR34DRAFT_237540 [Clohesyomyces aquaticus]